MRLPLPAQMPYKMAAFRLAGPILAPLAKFDCGATKIWGSAPSAYNPKVKRRRLQRFLVELAAIDWFRFPQRPFLGKTWRARFIRPTTDHVAIVHHGRSRSRAKQLVIEARDEKTAQRALNLIIGALNIASAGYVLSTQGDGSPRLYVEDSSKRGSFRFDNGLPPGLTSTSNIPLACMIAARASLSLARIYALAKLSLSIATYSVQPLELDPQYRGENIPKSAFPEDHVRVAFAITAAYSCIEELQLEIRASNKNPSQINGKWTPKVLADLETRLRSAGINLGERFLWTIRGPRTKIEMRKPPVIARPASWSNWRVRDGEMEVVDALSLASFLRGHVTTHKADKRLLRVLSVYDATNVQFLARRLLLETLGFWRYLQSEDNDSQSQTD